MQYCKNVLVYFKSCYLSYFLPRLGRISSEILVPYSVPHRNHKT